VLGEKSFVCGAISKLFSTIITYPLTTIRTRVQQNQYISNNSERKYKNSWDITQKIIKDEGIRGFFKGLSPNLIRGIPHRGVYFYFY
jgi:solute carrier family 25 folate transporter 32